MLLLGGCTTVVTPPATVSEPATVYLAHYEQYHTSLVIPTGSSAVEYTYGDWDLFARARRNPWTIFVGMTFPTQGALGRREVGFDGNDTTALQRRLAITDDCRNISVFSVEQEKLDALLAALETAYESARASEVYNPGFQLTFVESPHPYAIWHTCNHALATWLEELDCSVRGVGGITWFEVETP